MVTQADLVKVIANACSNCRVAQDTVRSVEGGIPLILSHCNSDHTSPFLREWGILAVRNICAGNLENQVRCCAVRLFDAHVEDVLCVKPKSCFATSKNDDTLNRL